MSKADVLLRALVETLAPAGDPNVPQAILDLVAPARAYLNEKPHEPPQTMPMYPSGYAEQLRESSPPHAAAVDDKGVHCPACGTYYTYRTLDRETAAAEPEKPVAWMYESEHSCAGPFTFYPPPEGFTADEVKRGLHWVYADVECPHCGKNQPVAATQSVGGPCVSCGRLTGVPTDYYERKP